MTDEQFDKLLKLMSKKEDKSISENLQKIGTALCVAGILWVGAGITELDKGFAVMAESQKALERQVEVVTEFTKKPRFTLDDYKSEIKPVLQRLDGVELTIRERSNFMRETEDRLRIIERKMD